MNQNKKFKTMKKLSNKTTNFQITYLKLETKLKSKNEFNWDNIETHPTKPGYYCVKENPDFNAECVSFTYNKESKKLSLEIDVTYFLCDASHKKTQKADLLYIELTLLKYLGIHISHAIVMEYEFSTTLFTNDNAYSKITADDKPTDYNKTSPDISIKCTKAENTSFPNFKHAVKFYMKVTGTKDIVKKEFQYMDLVSHIIDELEETVTDYFLTR